MKITTIVHLKRNVDLTWSVNEGAAEIGSLSPMNVSVPMVAAGTDTSVWEPGSAGVGATRDTFLEALLLSFWP
jgi:hypothetical protein